MGWMYHGDPCHNCEDRVVGCHATCKKYLDWKEEIRKKKEIVQGSESTRLMLNDMVTIRSIRIERRYHTKRRK